MLIGKSIFRYISLPLFLLSFYGFAQTSLEVEKINFIGNDFFADKKLKGIIKSREGKDFDSRLMKLDQVLLTNYYLRNGFLKVFVSSDFTRRANEIYLEYTIQEGRRYYLKEIVFSGNTFITDKALRDRITHSPGKPYQSQLIAEGITRIESYYHNRGKPFVEIIEQPEIVDDSLIVLNIQIMENETVRISEVQINGLESVRRYVAKRELEIGRGDLYSREKIDRSQRNLYSTGLFRFVNVRIVTPEQPAPQPEPPLAADGDRSLNPDTLEVEKPAERWVNLVITVEEKKSRWMGVRLGVAYEQEIIYGGTFDFGVEAGHRNLFGTGRSASIAVIPSLGYDFQSKQIINPKNQYSFNYVEPWVGYTRTRGILNIAYYQVRPTRTASYNFLSTSFRVTHEFPNLWSVQSEVAFQNIDTDSLELLTNTQGQDNIYSLSFDLIRDKRDNYLNTQSGYLMEFRNKFVYTRSFRLSRDIRRINRFVKLTAMWNRYQPFPLQRGWTLASRVRGGAILGINRLTRVPPTERFYLGGASSVRGYPEQLLGPVLYDDEGNAVALGGQYMILANLELRIPLFWLFYGTIFTDGGNVWSNVSSIDFFSLKASSGAGLAFMTPLGAIRFDYGRKWFPEARESKGEFHIGISFAF